MQPTTEYSTWAAGAQAPARSRIGRRKLAIFSIVRGRYGAAAKRTSAGE